MLYEKKNLTMSDGNENVVHIWHPDGDVKACVVLSHGMAEHASRYERFADALTSLGFALYAEDHRGHGETAALAEDKKSGKRGYLADKDGFFRVVDDIHEEISFVKKNHPGKKIFLFGHSFGSFVSQCFIEKYGAEIDGCVLCGTAGPRNGLVAFAKCVGGLVALFGGKKRVSKFVNALSFGSYNSRIKNPRTLFDWLSRDNAEVDKYIEDEWCGFLCTTGFFCDMFAGLSFIHKKENMAAVPKNLPVLFIDGSGDPVGDYGKTVQNLFEIYRQNGMEDVRLKMYEEARHELLNETNRDEITSDVIGWMEGELKVES